MGVGLGLAVNISVLGSTGSIGTQTLDVVREHRGRFNVVAVSGKNEVGLLEKQIREFRPRLASVASKEAADALEKTARENDCTVLLGKDSLREIATMQEADVVVGALVGFLGLEPTLEAINAGKRIALANKETLVAAGHLVMKAVEENNAVLTPIDSEHSALFQCLQGEKRQGIKRMVVTCSGGAFKFKKKEELLNATPQQALGHPTWSMGAKITIDSATLFNKGLEVIEAHWLYGVPYERIETVMHPQSIVHSMVEFVDGSVMAQLATHDMRLPIQYALSYPERFPNSFPRLDFLKNPKLEFFPIDHAAFPGLGIAVEAGRIGGTMPAVMNAANEEAVMSFLSEKTPFLSIADTVQGVMERHSPAKDPSLGRIKEADEWARKEAKKIMVGGG